MPKLDFSGKKNANIRVILMPEYENFHFSNFSCNYFGIICNAKDYRDCICTDRYAFEIAIVENVQKKTLNLIDEAKAFKKYVFDNRWGSVSELATKLGKSVAYITKRLMLLDLPSEVTKAINENLLGPSIAEELFSIR